MWGTPQPVTYPSDPDEPVWNYTQGAQLRDPSGKELADYHARLVGWYTRGGFVDEYGKRHESGGTPNRKPRPAWYSASSSSHCPRNRPLASPQILPSEPLRRLVGSPDLW
jgi:hypothetical protein